MIAHALSQPTVRLPRTARSGAARLGMNKRGMQRLWELVGRLTRVQCQELIGSVTAQTAASESVELLEATVSRQRRCPHCAGQSVVRIWPTLGAAQQQEFLPPGVSARCRHLLPQSRPGVRRVRLQRLPVLGARLCPADPTGEFLCSAEAARQRILVSPLIVGA